MDADTIYKAIKTLSRQGYFVVPEPVNQYQNPKPKCYIRIIRPNENRFREKRYLTRIIDHAKKVPVVLSQKTQKDTQILHDKIKKVILELVETINQPKTQSHGNISQPIH